MKAAFIEKTGGPEVIQYGDLPKPIPQPGEVLVRIRAAAVNPIDLYIRSGAVSMSLPKPYIPGCDLSGVVEAVGQGAGRFQPTNRVWGSNQGLMGRQGTLAEYACVAEEWLYPTPANVSDEQAAAAALTGITAHLGLFRCARLQAGETVFVNGGTGGVGSMVVQMTRAVGAHVIATVGSAEKAAKCREWWTDLVLNYKTDDVDQGIRDFTKGKGVDVWFETQREPDLGRMVELVRQRGRIVLIAGRQAKPTFPVGPFYVKDLSLYGFAIFNASADEQRHCAENINRWLQENKLKGRDRQNISIVRSRGRAPAAGGKYASKSRNSIGEDYRRAVKSDHRASQIPSSMKKPTGGQPVGYKRTPCGVPLLVSRMVLLC